MLFLMALFVGCVPPAFAQESRPNEYPKFEWFVGYTALGDLNQDNGKILTFFGSNTGFETSLTRNLSRRWGIKGDFSSHFGTNRGRGSFGQPFTQTSPINGDYTFEHRLFNFLVGPEFKARNRSKVTPLAFTLVGVGLSRGEVKITFPTSTGNIKVSDTGIALALGGGFDVKASNRFGFRVTADYNTVYAGGNQIDPRSWRDHIRFSFGIVVH
jgi:hypothetical protein